MVRLGQVYLPIVYFEGPYVFEPEGLQKICLQFWKAGEKAYHSIVYLMNEPESE